MTQRPIGSLYDQSPLETWDPKDDRALERMNFFVADWKARNWERMNWYVTFTNRELAKLSAGEVLTLQEEILALRRTLTRHPNASLPTFKEMEKFQQDLFKHFRDLVDGGRTVVGPFSKSYEVTLPQVVLEQAEGLSEFLGTPAQTPSKIRTRHTFKHTLPLRDSRDWDNWLLDHMGRLLEQFGASIRRCHHCSKFFLQLRRNAMYCGRSCQSVAVMRRIRQEGTRKQRVPRKVKRAKIRTKGPKKGGIRYGKKGR